MRWCFGFLLSCELSLGKYSEYFLDIIINIIIVTPIAATIINIQVFTKKSSVTSSFWDFSL